MLIKDVIKEIEAFAPPALKEDFDNVGLLVGSLNAEVKGVLVTLDITEEVVDEAIATNCNLIVAHHPIILSGIKQITDRTTNGRILMKAIRAGIGLYAAHTNIDNVAEGVSGRMAKKLGLIKARVLSPMKNSLVKLVTFVPEAHADMLRKALFEVGGGNIGNYDSCSFNVAGEGTFRAGDLAQPFVGKVGALHSEKEIRVELILPSYLKGKILDTLLEVHPYEEVAYDLYTLENDWPTVGLGVIGEFEQAMSVPDFLKHLKAVFQAGCIRYTETASESITKVAVCGGSGSFLLKSALAARADAFVTGDFKYHQFFDAENQLMIADIGHFESEQFTKELFFELLTKKISNFAVRLSKVNTNPIKYF